MQRTMNWFERFIVPFATKIGTVRWLVALRDAFVTMLPITIAGSFAVLLNSLVDVLRTQLNWITFAKAMGPLVAVDNVVYNGTFSVFSLFFAATWGYYLAKSYETNGTAGALVSLSSFIMSIANVAKIKIPTAITDSTITKAFANSDIALHGRTLKIGNVFAINQLSTSGIFTAMLFGALGTTIFILLFKTNLIIKLPTSVPRSISNAFGALIPGIVALYTVGFTNFLFTSATGMFFGDWLNRTVQLPFLKAGQSFSMVILITFLVQVFWFFGINGTNVLGPVLDSIWLVSQNMNVMAANSGENLPYKWVRGSFDAFVWFGGAGGTLVLVIVLLLFSKRKDEKTTAKVALAPQIFNINEPIMFGLPIVLNAVYFIPFVVAPLVNVTLAYFVTQAGWVNPVQVAIPAFMPPLLQPFLATNYDYRAIILALLNMVIAFFIWLPFVLAANKVKPGRNERPTIGW